MNNYFDRCLLTMMDHVYDGSEIERFTIIACWRPERAGREQRPLVTPGLQPGPELNLGKIFTLFIVTPTIESGTRYSIIPLYYQGVLQVLMINALRDETKC